MIYIFFLIIGFLIVDIIAFFWLLVYFIIVKDDKNDPLKDSQVYKKLGCSHVDGLLCDFPNCSLNNEFINEAFKNNGIKRKL